MAFWNKKKDDSAAQQQTAQKSDTTAAQPAQSTTGTAAPMTTPTAAAPAQQQTTTLSTELAETLGKVTAVLMLSERFQSFTLQQMKTMVLPPVAGNQFVVAEARPKGKDVRTPIGLVLWAKVSDELDRKFAQDPGTANRLVGKEWNSGENIWIIETVGPPEVVQEMMKQLVGEALKGKQVKMRVRNSDGSARIEVLAAAA